MELALAEMGAEVHYRPGKNHVRADTMSRLRHTDNLPKNLSDFQVESEDEEIIRTYESIGEFLDCVPFHCHCEAKSSSDPHCSWYTCGELNAKKRRNKRRRRAKNFTSKCREQRQIPLELEYQEISLLEDITPPCEFDELVP